MSNILKIKNGDSWQTIPAIKGDKGDTGYGTPTGGTTGQVLKKRSNTDYDFEWGSTAGGVNSVNNKTGDVVLDAEDVGALPDTTTIPDELSDLQDDATHRTVTDTEKAAWNGKYSKPQTGIPKSDMDSSVQISLGKADTAIQSHQSLSSYRTSSEQDIIDNGKLNTTLKGASNGLAELDSNGKVPSSQLPSYVDDVLEYNSVSAFPSVGESGKIYIALDTNKTYRWGGSEYVEISSSLALGETSATAYRGDRGKTAYEHSQLATGNPHNVSKSDVGLGNVPNTDFTTPVGNATTHIADSAVHVTQSDKNNWNGKSDFSGSYNDLTNKPSSFPPSSHTHVKNDITDFAHTHTKSQITDFPSTIILTATLADSSTVTLTLYGSQT